MATTLYLRNQTEALDPPGFTNDLKLATTAGTAAAQSQWTLSASGNHIIGLSNLIWVYRVNAVTISGTVTCNIWSYESEMTSNARPAVRIVRLDNSGTILSDVIANANAGHPAATEASSGTPPTVRNWTATPTSTDFSDGDWIGVIVHADAAGTMGTGSLNVWFDQDVANTAECFVTFTETITAFTGGTTVTPTTAALTIATFAPTVTASDHQTVTPGVVGLTLATFAPSAIVGTVVTPDTAALVTATFAPTVTATENVTVTPTTAALTLAAFAPTVTVSDHQTVTPGTVALTTATFAPVVGLGIIPAAATLTLTTFAPNVTVSDNIVVTPGVVALNLAAFAPSITVSDNVTVIPTTLALTLATFAPTVTAGSQQVVTPGTLGLTLATFAPIVTATDNIVVTPGVIALNLATFAPTVTATSGGPVTVTPTTLALILTAYVPGVTVSGLSDQAAGGRSRRGPSYAPWIVPRKRDEDGNELDEEELLRLLALME